MGTRQVEDSSGEMPLHPRERAELLAEIERLHKFTEQLSERLFLAAEVLARLAERKTKK